jgi:four helix bundle protein
VQAGWKTFAHEKLDIYRVARRLVSDVYLCTRSFPGHEQFGLTSQIRRAAVSIPSNIAEGAARGSRREFARSLLIARGSMSELRVLSEIALDNGYLKAETFAKWESHLNRLSAMASGLIRQARPHTRKEVQTAPSAHG